LHADSDSMIGTERESDSMIGTERGCYVELAILDVRCRRDCYECYQYEH